MCGFFGAISFNKINLQDFKFHSYRGPDDYNETYFKFDSHQNISLNHSRLRIIGDNISGKQPKFNNNICMVFNGEIFGENLYHFENSDTLFLFNKLEKLVIEQNIQKLYDFLNSLNGFFSIALLDRINNQIFLIRDRYGQKPLYFSDKKNNFCFGSCIKDLRNYLGINIKSNKVNLKKGGGFIYDELNPVNNSNIKQVAPGQIINFKNGKINYNSWSKVDRSNQYMGENYQEYLDRLDYLLNDSIKIRCIYPRDIAISLSGGYDSSLVASYLSKYKSDLKAFTLSVKDIKFNEVSRAKFIAEKLKIPLEVIEEKDPDYEQYAKLSKILEIPAFNPSFTAYDNYYSNLKGKYKVVIEGHGADEIYGGYPINYIEYMYCLLKNVNLKDFNKSLRISKKSFGFNSFHIYKSLLIRLIYGVINKNIQTPESLIKKFFNKYSLPSNLRVFDRVTLFNNLEHRCPFLDKRIVELAQSTPYKILFKDGVPKAPICSLLKRKGLYLPSKKIGFTSSFDLRFLSKNYRKVSRTKTLNNYFKNIEEMSNNFLNE